MTAKSVLKNISQATAATLVTFALVEILLRITYLVRNSTVSYVPLPYVIGDNYGPLPPWVDDLRILQPDSALIWTNRPNLRRKYIDIFSPVPAESDRISLLRQFFPAVPDSLKNNPVWAISLNSSGFRDLEFPKQKSPSVLRIICLGDSWTFGANVGQEQAYPQRLRNLLKQQFPNRSVEVLNLGVLGYSSFQGLELLKRWAIELEPDIVVLAFAMNDASVDGYRDKDIPTYKEAISLPGRIGSFLEKIEFYKLLRYVALLLKDHPKSMGDHLKNEAASSAKATTSEEYEKLEPWTRVSPKDYKRNILEMINLARSRKADAVLVFNGLSGQGPYRTILEEISKTRKQPSVDSSALIADARRKIEGSLEQRLGLQPPTTHGACVQGEVEVVFRVYTANRPVRDKIYIAGAHPKLGDQLPNAIAMYDDGTHGDQKAGDRVWSFSATFSPGTRVFYVYTNSGARGKWEGLDVPVIREFTLEAANGESRTYRPIETFGEMYMQADPWHTNAQGYELIAKAVLGVLNQNEKFRQRLIQ